MDAIRNRLHVKSRRDLVEAAAWLVLVVTGLVMSLEFDELRPGFDLTPAFWPQVILIVAGIFAIVLLASSLSFEKMPEREAAKHQAPEQKVNLHVLIVFAVPILYVYAMHKIGFLLVTPVFLPLYMYMYNDETCDDGDGIQ